MTPSNFPGAYYFDDAMTSTTAAMRDWLTADLEYRAIPTRLPDHARRWYDVRPMLDPDCHAPEVVSMNERNLAVGLAWRVLHQHPELHHLVCIEAPELSS